MPAATGDDPPTITSSFANNFWGRGDAGVQPILDRMTAAKQTSAELIAFYRARADLEEEYSKKLLAISRKCLGSTEMGTLRASLDVARGETESMGKQHALIAEQMKRECEEPLTAFSGGLKERRKIIQNTVEKLHKTKQQQTAQVNKCRDKFEQDCLRIKGYLAQGHMVMGQEERRNKAKLEKTQIAMASNSQDYEAAVKVLEETTGRWNKEWKAACDKFQDLEEERLDFTKSSLWEFANIASTVCVTDDASYEKIRLALENCEVEKDIANFITVCGTGQEIPDPPRYINFAKADCDSASEISDDENNYSVAQFPRSMNPAFRTASPLPDFKSSTNSKQSSKRQESEEPEPETPLEDEPIIGPPTDVPDPNSGRPQPLTYRAAEVNVPPNYSPSQHGQIAAIPHNEYPYEGMTMHCRRDEQPSRMTQSELSTSTRPPSRDDHSDYSNPSSFTSAEPMSGHVSPIKPPVNGVQMPGMSASPEKGLTKRRSGFFSKSPFNANSPFRRKSKKEPSNPLNHDRSWQLNGSDLSTTSAQSSPTKQVQNSAWNASRSDLSTQSTPAKHSRQPSAPFNRHAGISAPEGEEPADPRAHFQLNIGQNVLDVASPDTPSSSHQSTPRASQAARRGNFAQITSSDDPVAQALANLKQGSGSLDMSKRASLRQPVDAYHRVKTPAPDSKPSVRPAFATSQTQDVFAAQRGTPPPAYEGRAQSALGVPRPAFTSRDMVSRTENWGNGSSVSAPVQRPGSAMSRPASRDGRRSPGPAMTGTVPRAPSPQPPSQALVRARSPAPQVYDMPMRARSPAPPQAPPPEMRSRSPAPPAAMPSNPGPIVRARSPAPEMRMRGNSSSQHPQNQYQPRQPVQQQSRPQQMPPQQRAQPMPQQTRGQPQPRPGSQQPPLQRPVSQQTQQQARPMSQQQQAQVGSGRSRQGMSQSANARPTSSYAPQSRQQEPAPSSYDQRGRAMDASVRRERSKSMAAPMSARSQSRQGSANQYRSTSPNPYTAAAMQAEQRARSGTSQYGGDMGVQLAPAPGEMAMYEPPGTADVSPAVCFMARAQYSYSAAIPEELTFSKGDILAVLRLQDDGWWEAEVHQCVKTGGPGPGGVGLVPSNYLQRC